MLDETTTVQPVTDVEAVSIIGSIFRVRRDLVALIKQHVTAGTGLSLEQAELLYDLFGAAALGWQDPKAISGGWVPLGELKKSLVHAPELLTRRLSDLARDDLVEIAPMTRDETRKLGLGANSKKARLRPAGKERAKIIHGRYCRVCNALLQKLPPEVYHDARKVKAFNLALIAGLRFTV